MNQKKRKIVNVWVYTRVSSKQQYDSNHSLENQITSANTVGKEKGIIKSLMNLVTLMNLRKNDFTRKEFMKLINEVKRSRQKPFAIMIYKMSRFSRSGGSAIGLVNDLSSESGSSSY